MSDDELSPELESYLLKYVKRTGVFRLYQLDREKGTTRLLLEFVIRGKVLFKIYLWKRNHNIFGRTNEILK
jgi:hypothetical protein